mgnify:CR=1 FL=1
MVRLGEIFPVENEIKINNSNYLVVSSNVELIDNLKIKVNNDILSFDYLIFDNVNLIINFKETNILHENKIPITNFYNATSIENIFYSKDILNTIIDIENGEI